MRALILTALTFLTLTSTANAGVFLNAVKEADAFWTSQGYSQCPAQIGFYAPDGETLAKGDIGGCVVQFNRAYVDEVHDLLEWAWPRMTRRQALTTLCVVAVHERGHNLGFGHVSGTVMDENVLNAPVPGRCIDWAVAATPKPKSRQ